MNIRWIDQDTWLPRKELHGFVRRQHFLSPIVQFAFYGVFLLCLCVAIYSLHENTSLLAITLGGLSTITILFSVLVVNTRSTIVTMTEFQNALFASAAGVNTEFFMILKRGGDIMYTSPGFAHVTKLIEERGAIGLDTFFANGWISEECRNTLIQAAQQGFPAKGAMVLPLADEGQEQLLLLEVLPITLPSVVRASAKNSSEEPTNTLSNNLQTSGEYLLLRATKDDGAVNSERLMNHLNLGLYYSTNDGHITHSNRAFCELLGHKEGDFERKDVSLSDLLHRDEDLEHLVINQDNWHGEVIFRKKNHAPLKTLVNQISITAKDGVVKYKYGLVAVAPSSYAVQLADDISVAFDIGWQRLLENSPIAQALIDRQGRIKQWNGAFKTLINSAQQHATPFHTSLFQLINADDRPRLEALVDIAARRDDGHMIKPIEVKLKNDQASIVMLYAGQLQHVGDATPNEYIVHLIDITEQKNLEFKFAHSQKMQAVGQLAGGIAHDFNNLLTAMMGFCDLLIIRHPPGDQSFADIMQIKQNTNRAANLVRQLLAFSRKQTLQPKVIDITNVLVEMSSLIRRLIGENIGLSVEHGQDLWPVKVDQGQFEQVILNLAVNARDAMEGGGTLTISTRNITVDKDFFAASGYIAPEDDDPILLNEDYVLIEVIDTGCGIPSEVVRKVFEPFFTTKEVGSGTGLGLSTVYGIVKQTGGHIFVKSMPSTGTIFILFLRRCTAAEGRIALEQETETRRNLEITDLTGSGSILLVEDEDAVRAFSKTALEKKGYNVFEASSGETALELMKEHGNDIQVIITDVMMPGINGPNLVKRIRIDYPNIKVIFISGYTEDSLSEQEADLGHFYFLAKPYSLKQLAKKVKDAINDAEL